MPGNDHHLDHGWGRSRKSLLHCLFVWSISFWIINNNKTIMIMKLISHWLLSFMSLWQDHTHTHVIGLELLSITREQVSGLNERIISKEDKGLITGCGRREKRDTPHESQDAVSHVCLSDPIVSSSVLLWFSLIFFSFFHLSHTLSPLPLTQHKKERSLPVRLTSGRRGTKWKDGTGLEVLHVVNSV